MTTDRDSLIDYIDEYYNNEDGWDLLSSTMISLFGDKVLNEQDEIDDEGDEGIYTYLSNLDLEKLADRLDSLSGGNTLEVTLRLTDSQLSTLKEILSDFSDVTFTEDRQMSKDATLILRQLEE